MTANVIEFIKKEDVCQDCKKRVAVKLCDYVIGEEKISFFRSFLQFKHQKNDLLTCDRNLCGKCAIRYHNMDLCRQHHRKMTRR